MSVSVRRFRLLLAALVVLYLAQGLYFSRVVVPVADGIQYLMIGARVVRGEMGVFDDRLPGNRMPIPFYVLGLTQLGGATLIVPRLLNVVFGFCTLLLTIGIARRLAGERAGLLAGLFLATQGVIIVYWSYEGYPAFAALALTATVYLLFARNSPSFRALGAVATGLLLLVRSNLWPAVPFLFLWALWRARNRRERAALTALAVIPTLVYLVWAPDHLKIFAYVPVIRRLVASLGYDASLVLDVQDRLSMRAQLWGLLQIVRRYEFWVLASAVLATLLVSARRSRRILLMRDDPRVALLASFLIYMLAATFMMFRNFKWLGLYFASFAPLLPLLLGIGFSEVFGETSPGSWRRRLLAVGVACLVVPPLYWVRNPILPIGAVRASDPFAAAHDAAEHLHRAVPADARVFFYGLNTAYYLSGLPQTYLQMLYNPDALSRPVADEQALRRFGMVPLRDIERWLGEDAGWAVIDTRFFALRIESGEATGEHVVRDLLGKNFELVDRVEKPPFQIYAVYRRKTGTVGPTAAAPPSARAPDTTDTGRRR